MEPLFDEIVKSAVAQFNAVKKKPEKFYFFSYAFFVPDFEIISHQVRTMMLFQLLLSNVYQIKLNSLEQFIISQEYMTCFIIQ